MTTDTAHCQDTRTQTDILEAQLAGIDAWNAARRASEAAAEISAMTPETQLDASRQVEVRRREHAAVIARADAHLREAGGLLGCAAPVRAVIAHRNAWLRDKVATRLVEHGVSVVAAFEDGADAAGAAVVEQPELVFVEDLLPTLSGLDVLGRVRAFAPVTLVGVQVLDGSGVARFIEAGAKAVFTRQIPPVDIADQLVCCLHSERHVRRIGRQTARRASSATNHGASDSARVAAAQHV